MRKTFSFFFKSARTKKNLTIQVVADKLKVSQGYINKIEIHSEIPKKDLLIEMCKLLNLDIKKMIQVAIKQKLEVYEKQLRKRYDVT